jgi:hypothetical protein
LNIRLDLAEITRAQLPSEMLTYRVLEEKLPFVEERAWQHSPEIDEAITPENGFNLLHRHTEGSAVSSLYTFAGVGYFLTTKRGGTMWMVGASTSGDTLKAIWDLLGVGAKPKEKKDKEPPTIHVDFWTVKTQFPRAIEAPKWKSISDNYAATTKDQLSGLMAGKYRPSAAGQLILWHGLPGTGKTWALRALGREWKKWAKLHYITDPDAFFGTAQYMLSVLLSDNRQPWDLEMDDFEDEVTGTGGPTEATKKNKGDGWKVIICEDTGELLAADAKQQTGQGLSRLLNIVDGMIGQGLRVVVLITTNEELKNLHPAVVRPGRCGALINFESFQVADQEAWLQAHGVTDIKGDAKGRTLAELYALIENRSRKSNKAEKKVGFA